MLIVETIFLDIECSGLSISTPDYIGRTQLRRYAWFNTLLPIHHSSDTSIRQVGSIRLQLARKYAKESTGEAAATTDTVEYTYVLVNNGLLSLYNISLHDSTLAAHGASINCTNIGGQMMESADVGVVTELAAYPNNGIAPAASITCFGTDAVFQDEVHPTVVKSDREVFVADVDASLLARLLNSP